MSKHDNDGYITGAFWEGDSLEFDGVDDFVNCGNHSSLTMTNQVSIEALVRVSVGASTGYVLAKNNAAANDAEYSMYYEASASCLRGYINATYAGGSANNSIIPGTWHHCVMVYNGVDVRFYVDSILSGTPTNYSTSITANSYYVSIGRRKPNNYFLDTVVALVRIYSIGITAQQVKECFEQTYRLI